MKEDGKQNALSKKRTKNKKRKKNRNAALQKNSAAASSKTHDPPSDKLNSQRVDIPSSKNNRKSSDVNTTTPVELLQNGKHKQRQNKQQQRNKKRRRSEASIDEKSGDPVTVKGGNTSLHDEDKSSTQIERKQEQRPSSLSLASRLKRQRGTASSTPLPPEWSGIHPSTTTTTTPTTTPRFLSPTPSNNTNTTTTANDPFQSCHLECYHGFHYETPTNLPPSLHQSFTSAFHALDDAGLFLYDVVNPGGKRLSRTFVTRTLIGSPGSTYRYLGLRLFSHPWCDVDARGDGRCGGEEEEDGGGGSGGGGGVDGSLRRLGYRPPCAEALIELGRVNRMLIRRTNHILSDKVAPTVPSGLTGSADYSLTLINRMEPTSVKKDLKLENIHGGLGKTSVSWHKDSGLQDFSSIAVYHTLETCAPAAARNGNDDGDDVPWRVALRVADPTTKTPALSVPLPSGSLYYLLDDFNHQHEHAVLAGSNKLRYSSTHRVAREGCGTWQYIRDKCESVLVSSNLVSKVISSTCDEGVGGGSLEDCVDLHSSIQQKRKQLVKEVRSYLMLMVELEFEWIRQWQIQGQHHAELHPYWSKPIQIMTETYVRLRASCCHIAQLLKKLSSSSSSHKKDIRSTMTLVLEMMSEDLFDVFIESVKDQDRLRSTWRQRLKDPIFSTLIPKMRPIPSTLFDSEETKKDGCSLPDTADLRKWRSGFVARRDGDGVSKHRMDDKKPAKIKRLRRNEKESSMTKKERKKVASNWERMKAQMKR